MMLKNILSNLSRRPATRPFPKVLREPVAGYRGAVEFDPETCIYCGACAVRCPTHAIKVDRANKTLEFDLFRCVQCGCCAEACKRGSVYLLTTYHAPVYEKPAFGFSGAPVLADDEARPDQNAKDER